MPHGSLLITGPTNMDLDAYACVLAYGELLSTQDIDHQTAIFGQPQLEVEFMAKLINQPIELSPINPSQYSRIALMDMSSLYKADRRIKIEQVVELIDHRKVNGSADFLNAKVVIDFVGAAATIIAEYFHNQNIEPSRESAALLYAAIISNTLNFQAEVTTQRDKEAAQWLQQFAQLPVNFAHQFFTAKSDLAGPKLVDQMGRDLSIWPLEGKISAIVQLEVADAIELIEHRKSELIQNLNALAKPSNSDFKFISICDIDHNQTLFITDHQPTQQILSRALNISFNQDLATLPMLKLRKEYVPLIKQVLSQTVTS